MLRLTRYLAAIEQRCEVIVRQYLRHMQTRPKEEWSPPQRIGRRGQAMQLKQAFGLGLGVGAFGGKAGTPRSMRNVLKTQRSRKNMQPQFRHVDVRRVEDAVRKVRVPPLWPAAGACGALREGGTASHCVCTLSWWLQRVKSPKVFANTQVHPHGLPATHLVPAYESPESDTPRSDDSGSDSDDGANAIGVNDLQVVTQALGGWGVSNVSPEAGGGDGGLPSRSRGGQSPSRGRDQPRRSILSPGARSSPTSRRAQTPSGVSVGFSVGAGGASPTARQPLPTRSHAEVATGARRGIAERRRRQRELQRERLVRQQEEEERDTRRRERAEAQQQQADDEARRSVFRSATRGGGAARPRQRPASAWGARGDGGGGSGSGQRREVRGRQARATQQRPSSGMPSRSHRTPVARRARPKSAVARTRLARHGDHGRSMGSALSRSTYARGGAADRSAITRRRVRGGDSQVSGRQQARGGGGPETYVGCRACALECHPHRTS